MDTFYLEPGFIVGCSLVLKTCRMLHGHSIIDYDGLRAPVPSVVNP
jgi:hypothetical protein